jgi:predicted nucleotidyltransferase
MVADPLAERVAMRMAASLSRAERLRREGPELARRLRAKGATHVILFGSLASGAPPHERTDIDLCVRGLSQADVERAALELAEGVGAVDLVRWETAPPELKGVVTTYGVPVEEP